jgi:hypothetical protein
MRNILQPPPTPPGPCAGAQHTYICDGSRFPNVCANAKSAIELRSFSRTYTRRPVAGGRLSSSPTSRWYDPRWQADNPEGRERFRKNPASVSGLNQRQRRDFLKGWGLAGCSLEEFPFDSWRQRGEQNAVIALRLIPETENSAQGNDHGTWISSVPEGETMCIGAYLPPSFPMPNLTHIVYRFCQHLGAGRGLRIKYYNAASS